MHWRSLLWTDVTRRLRAPVRLGVGLFVIALFAVVGTVVAELLGAAVWPDRPFAYVLVGSTVGLGAGAVVGVIVVGRWVDRRSLADYGFRDARVWGRDLVAGVGLAVLAWVAVFAAGIALGRVVVLDTVRAGPEGFVLALVASVVLFGVASLWEELVCRGFVLTTVAEGLAERGRMVAAAAGIVVSSLLFGALHLANAGSSVGAVVSVALIGLTLGVATVLTGRLGLAVGIHAGWNFALAVLLGYRVSGYEAPAQLLVVASDGPGAVWTGGAFGPEAGLFGLAAGGLVLLGVFGYVRLVEGGLQIRVRMPPSSSDLTRRNGDKDQTRETAEPAVTDAILNAR